MLYLTAQLSLFIMLNYFMKHGKFPDKLKIRKIISQVLELIDTLFSDGKCLTEVYNHLREKHTVLLFSRNGFTRTLRHEHAKLHEQAVQNRSPNCVSIRKKHDKIITLVNSGASMKDIYEKLFSNISFASFRKHFERLYPELHFQTKLNNKENIRRKASKTHDD